MLRKVSLIAVLGLGPAAALFAAGCASDRTDKPYGLAGSSSTIDEQERKERLRWTDDKGHYRPDLRTRSGPPLRNVR